MDIKTVFVYPPIPSRRFDWEAFDDDACGCPECGGKVGRGATEEEAIADLKEQLGLRVCDECGIWYTPEVYGDMICGHDCEDYAD